MRILRHDARLATGTSTRSAPPSRLLPTGTVTFAVVDVEGGPAAWAADAPAMSVAMVRHHERIRELARTHGGHVFTRIGDSHAVAFDTADQAAAWARDLQATTTPVVGHVPAALRVALHTGEAEEHDGGYFGPAVHTASRLAAVARGGQTVASAATAALLTDPPVRDLGRHMLDGVVAEQHLYQLDEGNHPPLRSEDRHRGNLPPRINRLVGREAELDRIRVALATHAVVTLVGPGGIGKTHLALAAAQDHAARDVWLIDLARIQTGTDVPRAVAEVLAVTERRGRTIVRSVVNALETRRALLVLDNCEHVVDAAADLAAAVADGCPHTRVLATSRERLGLTGERIITVPPLDPRRVRSRALRRTGPLPGPDVRPGGRRAVIAEICARLDGIPLAIELAAARAPSLSPADLLERLEHRLHVLDGTRRAGTDRHRTLWSAIRWSYDLLTPTERTVFRRLAVFTGNFDLSAAEWVAGVTRDDTLEVANALGRLTEQSLVITAAGTVRQDIPTARADPTSSAESSSTDTVTQEIIAERHAKWCWCEVTGIRNLLSGWDEIEGVARLTQLWPNLRAAFDWSCTRGRFALARALLTAALPEIVMRSTNELGDWAERLLAATPAADVETRALALYAAAHRYSMTQDHQGYLHLAAAIRRTRRRPDPPRTRDRDGRPRADGAGRTGRGRGVPKPRRPAPCGTRRDQPGGGMAKPRAPGAGRPPTAAAPRTLPPPGPPHLRQLDPLPPRLLAHSSGRTGNSPTTTSPRASTSSCRLGPTPRPSRSRPERRSVGGAPARAFRILRDHIDELLETDNMQAGMMDCIEFVTMMATAGQLDDAASVLAHLESSHLLDGPGWRMLVADAAQRIAQGRPTAVAPALTDDRANLQFMRNALDRALGPD